jgi:hypothetical protein
LGVCVSPQAARGGQKSKMPQALPTTSFFKGGRENKNDESDVHLPQPQKQSRYLLHFNFIFFHRFVYRVFGRFVKRRVQKHDIFFRKIRPSGLITKNVAFFSPSVILLDFFYRVCGRFVTRGKGSSKKRLKQIAETFPQPPKKALTYLLTYLRNFFCYAPPCLFCIFQLATNRGAAEKKKKKKNKCTYVLYLARVELFYTYDAVISFIAFLSSPYRKTPKNALKKIGEGIFFLDARPRKSFYHVFEFPSPRGA